MNQNTTQRPGARLVWTAGWNQHGYLPETEPAQFSTADEALDYLADRLEEFSEEDHLSPAQAEELANAAAACEAQKGAGEAWSTDADGWAFWVESVAVLNEEGDR